VLLIIVAIRLGLDSRDLLIGRAAQPHELARMRAEIESTPGVDDLLELLTMYLGPEHLIIAARVSLEDGIDADDVEDLADQVDQRLTEILPQTSHVFLDPTQQSGPGQPRARGSGCAKA
jgi:divalent metal cation (Fe/Co/Zn/Cd) transporter